MPNTLSISQRGSTRIISINRPKTYNALNAEVLRELDAEIDAFLGDSDSKGAIITGVGDKAFAAGADIGEIHGLDRNKAHAVSGIGQSLFEKIESAGKPVIAAVNGFALGGGCELCMSAHMRVASENAKFGQPEVNLGLVAGYGGTQRLVRLIGRSKATELLLTADTIKAEEARQLGLVNHVVPQAELIDKAVEILEKIYTKGPLAISLTLGAIHAGVYDVAKGYKTEQDAFAASASSHDGWEGTQAFLEKRKADFKGK